MKKLVIVTISLFGLAMSSTNTVTSCAGYKENDLYPRIWKQCLEQIEKCGEEANVQKTSWAKNGDTKNVFFGCKMCADIKSNKLSPRAWDFCLEKIKECGGQSKVEIDEINKNEPKNVLSFRCRESVMPMQESDTFITTMQESDNPVTSMQNSDTLNKTCAGYKEYDLYPNNWNQCLEQIEKCGEEANVQKTSWSTSDTKKVFFGCKMCAGYKEDKLSPRAWNLCQKKIKECGGQSKVEIDEINKNNPTDVLSFRCLKKFISIQESDTPNNSNESKVAALKINHDEKDPGDLQKFFGNPYFMIPLTLIMGVLWFFVFLCIRNAYCLENDDYEEEQEDESYDSLI